MRRLADFYRALSDMGQALLRLDDPGALYDATCRIAVESGRAAMAWIGLVDGGRLVPCAWAGEAAAYTQGLEVRVDVPDTPEAPLGPSAWAVREGRPYVANDFVADPRTRAWHERASRFGVRSSAAFPIRRGGVPVGALNLYFTEPHAFDDALVELLGQMVSDLSFALEHIDREAARMQAEREAHARDRQLLGIVESALDAIIALDRKLDVVLFNAAAARMFGVSPAEAIGRPVDRFVPPEFRAAHRHHLERFVHGEGAPRQMGHPREITGLRADGERFPMEASISLTGEGDHCLLTLMARDVTLLRQAEKAQLAHAAAEAANRAKTEFLSRISHELRTPLNAMLGFSRLMRAEAEDTMPPHQIERLDRVLLAGEHLRTLIEETLDVSRIEAGRVSIERTDFELCAQLDAVVAMCEPAAAELGVWLARDYAAQGPLLLNSDPRRVRQVMLNLISNAIKYNRRGGTVRVALEVEKTVVTLMVSDDGIGMSAVQRAQLFQPFNRLGRERSDVPGTGIGLVLVRQLVQLMGGELAIDSSPERGTEVRVRLPRPAQAPAAAVPHPVSPAAGTIEGPPQGLVLYVEDNAVNAILVEQLLARWPLVRLVVAPDGGTGLVQARALEPRLVLLDMQLPDMSGFDVLRRLQADPLTRGVPVVALSADAVPEDVAATRDAGATDYWTKPIDFDVFLSGVQRLLAGPAGPAPSSAPAAAG
jgi:PAS domain S-box-containing protein